MTRRLVVFALFLAVAMPVRAQSVDTAGAGALIAQAMDHSEVMHNLQYLSDVIGPRLSGSARRRGSSRKGTPVRRLSCSLREAARTCSLGFISTPM